jgi:hypothetical protein
MAAKKRAVKKKTAAKRSILKGRVAKAGAKLARVERELPETLREFSERVRKRLGQLERAVVRAEARYQREAVRALRTASHQLGRFEAEGERRWKRLTAEARREALRVLRRMEKALEGKAAAKPARRARRGRAVVPQQRGANGGMTGAHI